MREIKFRAWDKEKKEMREVTGINWYDEYIWVDETPMSGDKLPIESTPIMQFTGLLDKNGKEIYESDLLKIDMEKFGVSDAVYQVIWDTDGWALKDLSDPDLPSYIFHDKDRQEVIGNIYENPDLIIN